MKSGSCTVYNNFKNPEKAQSHPNLNLSSTASPAREQIPSFISDKRISSISPSHLQPSRLSHNFTSQRQSHTSNAFLHLRAQINHLRSQFSKLTLKDHCNTTPKSNQYSNHKQLNQESSNRQNPRKPTMLALESNRFLGYTEGNQIKSQKKLTQGQFSRFNVRKPQIGELNASSGNQVAATQENGVAQSILDKRAASTKPEEIKNVEILENQGNSLGKEAQRETALSAAQQKNTQQQYNEGQLQKGKQLVQLKMMLDQATVSLSLQANMLAKLQAALAKLQKQNRMLLGQAISRFQQINLQREKYQRELQLAEETHRLETHELQSKYHSTLESLRIKIQQNQELTLSLAEKNAILQKNRQLQKSLSLFQNYEQISKHQSQIHQRYAQANQQVKALRSNLIVKEAHIKSLYKDFAILDSQLRQMPVLKGQILTANKSIDEFNHIIIRLQLQKLNEKCSNFGQS